MYRTYQIIIGLLMLAVFAALSAVPAFATSYDDEEKLLRESGVDEAAALLDEESRSLLKDIGLESVGREALFQLDVKAIMQAALNSLKPAFQKILRTFLSILALLLIASLISSFSDEGLKKENEKMVRICIALVAVFLVIEPIRELLMLSQTVIGSATAFILALLPIVSVIMAAQGRAVGATVFAGSAVALSEIITFILSYVFMPLCSVSLGVGISCSFEQSLKAERLIAFCRKYVLIALSALASLYFTVLSVRSGLSANADEAGVKALKFASGNFVPVIGSAISDSAAVVISSLNLTKTTVTGFGLVALFALFLPLCSKMLMWTACFELSAFLCEVLEQIDSGRIFKSFSQCLRLACILCLFCALLLLINIGLAGSVRGAL